jgi:autotransporter-associated beta strand protein
MAIFQFRSRTTRATLLVAALGSLWATAALAQTFVPMGPSPGFGPTTTIQSADAPPNGTVSGAVQAIVTDPTNPNTMYIGATNGGVWVTRNGGASWAPLSDNQRSLSIASLSVDPTNPNVLIAGTGLTSNGFIGNGDIASRGGPRIGVLYSTSGGSSWSELGGATLQGKSIVGVAARGSTILAAAAEPYDANAAGGLFRSVNTGASFAPVTLGSGGGTVAVTALAADPNNQSVFYAAVNSTVAGDRGIYFSSSAGASWSKGLDLGAGQIARLATGPGGSVVAGIYDNTSNRLVGLKLSKNGGAAGSWIDLALPNTNSTGQASTNLALAIDKTNPNIVYVAGTLNNAASTLSAYRVVLNNDNSSAIQTLTDDGTANGSSPHADARAFAFDASGRLIMVGDGGVYVRTNPQGTDGVWTGLNSSTLQLREAYAIAYDAISKRLVVSAQDTGIAYQAQRGGTLFTAIGGGDGVNAVVNDKSFSDHSVIYTTSQNLGPLERRTVDAQGRTVTTTDFVTTKGSKNVLGFEPDDFTEAANPGGPLDSLPFSSKIVLNKIDPTKIAFGTNYVYATVDIDASSNTLSLTNLGTAGTQIGPITALAYGTIDTPDALLAGTGPAFLGQPGRLFLSTMTAAGSLTQLTAYAGGTPSSVVFDNRTMAHFYVADTAALWGTNNTGTTFTDLTSNVTALNIVRPTSLEFISNNGVNALLVGGLSNVVNGQNLAVADSDPAGNLANWRTFGFGLPNTIVNQIVYNPAVDVLALSLFGRGAWLLYDVTAYFPTATVLRFGLADNDSAPPVSFLTNGIYATRSLEKVGSGTLTISGTTAYTGSTSVLAGQLVANGNLSSSSGVFIAGGAMLSGTGIVPSTVVSGALAPGNSPGTLTVAGNLTFNGGSSYLIAVAGPVASRTNVSGTATLGGTVTAAFQPGVLNQRYTILSAAGGRVGAFDSSTISGLPGFINGSLGYTPTDAFLNLQASFAATPGLGGNQRSVARALDTAFNAGPGLGAMPALFGLTPGQIPSSLSILAGDNASVGESVTMAAGSQFAALMANRSATRRAGDQTAELAAACNTAAPTACDDPPPPSDWSAWATAFGGAQWLNADPVTGSAAAQQNIGGGAFGGDYRAGPQTLVGVAAGLSDSNYSVSATGASGRATGAHFGLYGMQDWRTFYVNAAVAYSRFDGNATRSIAGIGNTETAKSSTVSSQLAGRVEVGRPFEVGQFDGAQFGLTPFAALQPSQLWLPGVVESSVTATGAPGVFALAYQPQATTSLPTFLGAQLDAKTELNGRPLTGWLRAAWVHEFLTSRSVTAGFTVLPGSSFTVDGARAASDAARFDFGVKYAVGSQTSLFANGNVELSDRGQAIAGTVGLRIVW